MAYPDVGVAYTSTPGAEHADFVNSQSHPLQPARKSDEESSIYGAKGLKNTLYVLSRKSLRKKSLIRRLVYIICGCAVLAIWIGVMIAFANQEAKYAEKNKTKDFATNAATSKAGLDGDPLLKGTLRQFDVQSRTLTVQWSGVLYNASDPDNFQPLLTDVVSAFTDDNGTVSIPPGVTTLPIAIYQDVKAVRDVILEGIDSDFIPSWSLENRTARSIGFVGVNEWDSFNTDIDLSQGKPGSVWQQPLFGYPFDFWSGDIVLTANIPDVANYIRTVFKNDTRGSFVLPFSHVTLADSILNWDIEATSNNTCVNEDGSDTPTPNCELHINFTAKRPAIVIFCVIVVVIINWLSTGAIFALTCESVFLKRPHILDEIDILGVCFAALFALPSVRSLLPAAPEFAAIIDLIGILPNVIIISICTTIVAFDRIINRRAVVETDSESPKLD